MIASSDLRRLNKEVATSRRHIRIPAMRISPGLLSIDSPDGPVGTAAARTGDEITVPPRTEGSAGFARFMKAANGGGRPVVILNDSEIAAFMAPPFLTSCRYGVSPETRHPRGVVD